MKLIKMKTKKMSFAADVDLERLATQLVGCSGAEIDTLLRITAMRVLADGRFIITWDDLDQSRDRVLMGVKKPRIKSDSVNWNTA